MDYYIKLACLCVFALSLQVNTINLPRYVRSCQNDSKISECWKLAIENLRPRLVKGIRQFHLPPIDPLHIQSLTIKWQNSNIADFRANMTDTLWTGVKDFKILEIDVVPNKLFFSLNIIFPKVHVHTMVHLNGTVLGFQMDGIGKVEADMDNLALKIVLHGNKYVKNEKEFINWKKEYVNVTFGNVFIQAYDILQEPQLHFFNTAINNNIKLLDVACNAAIEHMIGSFAIEVINRVHRKYSTDIIYPNTTSVVE